MTISLHLQVAPPFAPSAGPLPAIPGQQVGSAGGAGTGTDIAAGAAPADFASLLGKLFGLAPDVPAVATGVPSNPPEAPPDTAFALAMTDPALSGQTLVASVSLNARPGAGAAPGDEDGVGTVSPTGSGSATLAALFWAHGARADARGEPPAHADPISPAGGNILPHGGGGRGETLPLAALAAPVPRVDARTGQQGMPFETLPVTPNAATPNVLAPASPAPARGPEAPLALPQVVGGPNWGESLGHRVVWMARETQPFAELRLNPPHLGPLEVRISVSQGEANAQFFSPHPQVREAVDAALPKLREMLADAGLTLIQAEVSQESFREREARGESVGAVSTGRESEDSAIMPLMRPARVGLVDLYA